MLYIVGPMKLQNELMASFLSQILSIRCEAADSLEALLVVGGNGDAKPRLILWDCMVAGTNKCFLELENAQELNSAKTAIALFNLRRDGSEEEKSIARGIRGFFYNGDSVEQIAKGINALMQGELWISRKVIGDYIMNNHNGHFSPENRLAEQLTRREKEILMLIAKGVRNEEIASALFISRHTAKTHVYNIFKKINVANRLQADIWVRKHLTWGTLFITWGTLFTFTDLKPFGFCHE